MFWIMLAAAALLLFITVTLFSAKRTREGDTHFPPQIQASYHLAMEASEEFIELDRSIEAYENGSIRSDPNRFDDGE
ncbi:MAG: hypothetical protein FWF59_15550 [Turicibacter sp.]|nr:hypothetical protein [Turicibacter sp.]